MCVGGSAACPVLDVVYFESAGAGAGGVTADAVTVLDNDAGA